MIVFKITHHESNAYPSHSVLTVLGATVKYKKREKLDYLIENSENLMLNINAWVISSLFPIFSLCTKF